MIRIICLLLVTANVCFAQTSEISDSQKRDAVCIVFGKEITRENISPDGNMLERTKGKMTNSQFDAWLNKYQVDRLKQLIGDALIKRFLREQDIKPTDEEIKSFVSKSTNGEVKVQKERIDMREKLLNQLKSPDISSTEREKLTSQLQTMESSFKTDEWRKQYAKDNPARDQRKRGQIYLLTSVHKV